ncbi:MAG: geranylgeranyl pyrophosphate synthase [Planctomycetota bacterium]|jgi:geranylgeranyl pyrophosphate synthase
MTRREWTESEASGGLDAWLAQTKSWTELLLESALRDLGATPLKLAEAMEYALMGGGKRLRPALVRLFCQEFGGSDHEAGPPAVAIEMIHSYSLVHDDLPCMDDDDLRRGRPTCHKVYGEGIATLVGDGLLTGAFEQLAHVGGQGSAQMIRCLARSAGVAGMVGGQVLDLASQGSNTNEAEVLRIHQLKTGALIVAACEMGAIAGGADADQRQKAREFGARLGLLFQAVDDLLDVIGDVDSIGKTPGKDVLSDKPTLVAVRGFEGARARSRELAGEARASAISMGMKDASLALELVDSLLSRTA